jgi:hypothetical protein
VFPLQVVSGCSQKEEEMNYQTPGSKLQGVPKEDAAKILKRFLPDTPEDQIAEGLSYYAWPETFGSTCGPFHGIGGQVVTQFTIEAWEILSNAVLFCNGRIIRVTENFEPLNSKAKK